MSAFVVEGKTQTEHQTIADHYRILLLEDVPSDAGLIEIELKKGGLDFELIRVEDEAEFLKALNEFRPDLILADYTLPHFSAVDALRLLKQRRVTVPLILVTGCHSEEVAVECMREGAEDYIFKSALKMLPPAVLRSIRKMKAERERATTEAAFRRSEEQFRLITENSRDLICLLDLNFQFMYVSPSYHTVLGYTPRELLGRSCWDLIHPDDASLLRETLEEARFFKSSRQTELRFRHIVGNWQTFESAMNVIFQDDGKPQHALIVSRDMSDRKRAEKEIRKLAAFPRFNPNPILEFAADGSLTYFNDAALEVARQLKKPHPQALLPLNTATIVKICLSTGQNRLHLENTVGGRTLSWSFFPVGGNQVVHCYAEDVTERLNLEAQLRQVQKMESVGQLAAGVAHDFNNILTIIQGHAGLLLTDANLGPDALESAKQISLAAERAANLTRQLLMFSRKQIMQPHLLDLNEVISNVSKMLRTLLGERIVLRRNLLDELPSIYADPGMLEQVLVNLTVNARDAMPNGGTVTLSTTLVDTDDKFIEQHPEARKGRFVCVCVNDTGTGMDPATLGRIFEPFFTTKEVGKGTGLGLATVYGIVKQHQGWIEVQSEVGKGTDFKVFIPVTTKETGKSLRLRETEIPGGHETILIVEDESPLRELVQEILQKKGYRVLEAATGVQALKLWESHKDEIDLLLTDMMMPEGVSGRELAEKVLADRPDLKVIYTSGYSLDVISTGLAFQEGQNFLQKPYQPDALAQIVRNCLDS